MDEEIALREKEAVLAGAQRLARMGTWTYDVPRNRLVWSDEMYRMFGVRPEEFGHTQEAFLALVHPDDAEPLSKLFASPPRDGTPISADVRIRRADGGERTIYMRAEVQFDDHARQLRRSGIMLDITERKRVEGALRASETMLRSIIDSTPVPMALNDALGNITFVNPAFTGLLGYTLEDIPTLASWWAKAYPDPDYRARVMTTWDHRLEESARHDSASEPMEADVRAKSGAIITALVSAAPVQRNTLGGTTLVVLYDITDRRAAEERLRQSEERMRATVESALDCIITMNAEGVILDFNPAAERTFGFRKEDVIGRNLADTIIPPALRPSQSQGLRHLLATGQEALLGRRLEVPVVRADGTEILIELAITRLGSQSPPIFTGFMRDISDRKRAERQSVEQAALLDKAQDAILVRGLDQRISYWNKSAERVYGWTAEEAIGRFAPDILAQDRAVYDRAFAQVLETGEWTGELNKVAKNGTHLIVEGHWTLVRDEDGNPRSVMAIDTDITERKKLERQFLRAQRMESIGTLAGGIAHDLNNILAPIVMSIDVLKMQMTTPDQLDLLTTISTSAQRGVEMVRQVLSFARGMDGRRIEVQVAHLIHDVEKIARETFPRNIQIDTRLAWDLWTVIGDPTQLHQVMLNLCVNARDALPDGGQITIAAENVELDTQYTATNIDAKPGPHVLIEVADSGVGIPAALIDKIFDPFFTTKRHGKGTGLGLSTSSAIIKGHGGFIRVTSDVGKGTKFRVYLPAQTSPATPPVTAQAPALPLGNGETILVVDDEAAIRLVTRKTLEAFGYKVLLAADGAEAVSTYARHQGEVAVVLTDMMMPVMDGSSTINVLMKMNPDVRIIASSGISSNARISRTLGPAVKMFLLKPYSAETLLKALKAVCHPAR